MDNFCLCGCGTKIKSNKKYVSGHNLKNLKRTKEHNQKIGLAQKVSWENNYKRLAFGKRPKKPIGSKFIDSHGYISVKIKDGCKYWKLEHILIIEKTIGRKLKKGETVHHINGIRSDNNPDNLILCVSMSEHNKIEATWKHILRGLMLEGIVIFNREKRRYERP